MTPLLHGLRVLDLSSYIAGPFACSLLADLGAEVIKIEPPDGDPIRRYPSTLAGESRVFLGVNRGKSSIVLDLKSDDGRARFESLVEGADVLVENFRPGVMERLGFGQERLRQRHPRLIYCSLTGFGHDGPMRHSAGFDQVLQAMTGMNVFQGEGQAGADGDEAGPALIWGSPVDFYAASLCLSSVLAALYHRERSGEGQFTTMSLLAAALTMQAGRLVWADREPVEVSRDLAQGRLAGIHPTAEGHLYLSASTDAFWRKLCAHLGLADLVDDPRLGSVRQRAAHADLILPRLHAALARRSALDWESIMAGDVPCVAVRPIEAMFDHPQVRAEGLVAHMSHVGVGGYLGLASPFRFSACASPAPRPAPALDEHGAVEPAGQGDPWPGRAAARG
jgi:crotonobetainyl-CoA:carnitine CoA-transferase CaiB-like acyl-CoA transferase